MAVAPSHALIIGHGDSTGSDYIANDSVWTLRLRDAPWVNSGGTENSLGPTAFWPGFHTANSRGLEAMSFQVKDGVPWLFLVGTYDFQSRWAANSSWWVPRHAGGRPGDLFIWYGADKPLGNDISRTLSRHVDNSVYNYAYAASVGELVANGRLTVYDLNDDTLLQTVWTDSFSSIPWRVRPLKKGRSVDAVFATAAGYYKNLTPAQVSSITGDDYLFLNDGTSLAYAMGHRKSKPKGANKYNVLGIDLSFLKGNTAPEDPIWFSFTNERGDEVLRGSITGGLAVPDSGVTLALLSVSAILLTLAGRSSLRS